jgi:predicted DCC family thiol-disulfide oxidoreductase YuxK
MLMDISGPVLLFDGECGLCVACVRALWRSDARGRLRFAPLQGRAAQTFLRERGLPTADCDSSVFVADWSRRHEAAPLFRTDALCAACAVVGGGWRALSGLCVIPLTWRDAAYRLVARWRRWIFGGGDLKRLRSRPDWAARLLE